jgi:allophanate hydrolase subunit 2
VVTLRVVPGPHAERFTAHVLADLSRLRFTVSGDSNRVGLRLQCEDREGPGLLSVVVTGELDSQGAVIGAVQVPPDGQPIVLLPDHASLGGYPVVAVVATVDHGLLGQCAPGTVVALAPITVHQARAALHAARRALQSAVVGHYPLAVS